LDSIGNLVEPVRKFAKGDIRVAHVSTGEPAAASEHLLIFVTAPDNEGGSVGAVDCFAISARRDDEPGYGGFYALDFAKLRASYDNAKGLLLRVPASVNDSGDEKPVGDIKVRINRQNENSVTTEH
jgi:hypothetical protein